MLSKVPMAIKSLSQQMVLADGIGQVPFAMIIVVERIFYVSPKIKCTLSAEISAAMG